MMVFALCAAYWTRIYGEWEDLLNRVSDDFDEMVFAPLASPEEPQQADAQTPEYAARAETESGEAPVRRVA